MKELKNSDIHLLVVGDIILGNSSEKYFESVKRVLKKGDVVVGQLEVPYTDKSPKALEQERHPNNLIPLVDAGFDVLTLAGNHIADEGVEGIKDTIDWLQLNGIKYTGAGMNLQDARKPAIIDKSGTRFGVLKYNCVGPMETWASEEKPGCSYVNILTHYELNHANPGGPPEIYTHAEPSSLREMKKDIRELRSKCDVLIVSFHKGLVHQPVKIADYEKQISYEAIDAGADVVVGEHAHILKGIEIYKGKVIYHGLCNFIAYVPSLFPKLDEDSEAWSKKRTELFEFVPDPEYPTYPFHPEAIYTMIAKCTINNGEICQSSFYPCIVNKEGKPVVVDRDSGGQRVLDYMQEITDKAGLNAEFTWSGEEILISPKS